MSNVVCSSNELYHYGVKGMKWGVRRTPEQLGHKRRKSEIEKSKSNQKINGLEGYLLGLGISLIIGGVRYAASNIGNKKVMTPMLQIIHNATQ